MQEPHIHLKDNKQEIKITILGRKEDQPYGMDDNDFLPVKIEYKSEKESFIEELVYLDTYDMLCFYCSLDDISIGSIVEQGFSFFVEPYIDFLLENIDGKILFTIFYKENEDDKEEIIVRQKFDKKQFVELITDVHQGCNLWIDDSELIEFRENLLEAEERFCYEVPQKYRVAEVEFRNKSRKYYLCDDKNIRSKKFVIVPNFFGKNVVAKVVGIKYLKENQLPYSLNKMKKVIKRYTPLKNKINIHSHDITESGFGFELLVNFVIKREKQTEFSIKDKNAYFNVYLNEYEDVYLDVYKEMLELEQSEMKITKGLWLTAQKVLHVGFVEKKKNLKRLFINILDKAKELKRHWVGIPCVLEKYCRISPKTMFKIALKSVKEWIIQNENYDMEVLFCCPNEKLYKKFKKIYSKKIEQKSSN